jgi:hypothetical protein
LASSGLSVPPPRRNTPLNSQDQNILVSTSCLLTKVLKHVTLLGPCRASLVKACFVRYISQSARAILSYSVAQ